MTSVHQESTRVDRGRVGHIGLDADAAPAICRRQRDRFGAIAQIGGHHGAGKGIEGGLFVAEIIAESGGGGGDSEKSEAHLGGCLFYERRYQ